MLQRMKKIGVPAVAMALVLLAACGGGGSSGDLWTWIGGQNSIDSTATYGTLGVTDSNNLPGARLAQVSWRDSTGNTWVFGGYGIGDVSGNGFLADLWKYDGSNWTWVKGPKIINQAGTYSSVVAPGGRMSASAVVDSSDNLWLFGGYGYDSTSPPKELNDLWKFDGSSWTWVSGSSTGDQSGSYGTIGVTAPSNVPGGREGAVTWIDSSDNIWLFGGYGYDSVGALGFLNDLWKFDGTNWTWIAGANTANQAGTYGTQGVAAGSNVPGARYASVAWSDASGAMWLFGGDGRAETGSGSLNDLWKFDGSNWTWIAGAKTANQPGAYGMRGKSSASNQPGARRFAGITQRGGVVWLYGGEGYDSVGGPGYLNDLWKFDGSNWTWVSGAGTAGESGVYGIQGTADSANHPGARQAGSLWTDTNGNVWMFGGGYDQSSTYYKYNDLWRYQP